LFEVAHAVWRGREDDLAHLIDDGRGRRMNERAEEGGGSRRSLSGILTSRGTPGLFRSASGTDKAATSGLGASSPGSSLHMISGVMTKPERVG
jgi:hypothetical protein